MVKQEKMNIKMGSTFSPSKWGQELILNPNKCGPNLTIYRPATRKDNWVLYKFTIGSCIIIWLYFNCRFFKSWSNSNIHFKNDIKSGLNYRKKFKNPWYHFRRWIKQRFSSELKIDGIFCLWFMHSNWHVTLFNR